MPRLGSPPRGCPRRARGGQALRPPDTWRPERNCSAMMSPSLVSGGGPAPCAAPAPAPTAHDGPASEQCVELPAGRPVLPGILISVLAAGNQPVAAVIPRGRNLINLGGRQELGQTHPAATNIIGAILGRRPNFWGKSFTFFLKQKITKIANFSGCWGSAPDPAQHPKLRAAGAGRDGSLVGGDAGRARAPNPARIGATGRYPHLSSPRHLSTPHLPAQGDGGWRAR